MQFLFYLKLRFSHALFMIFPAFVGRTIFSFFFFICNKVNQTSLLYRRGNITWQLRVSSLFLMLLLDPQYLAQFLISILRYSDATFEFRCHIFTSSVIIFPRYMNFRTCFILTSPMCDSYNEQSLFLITIIVLPVSLLRNVCCFGYNHR